MNNLNEALKLNLNDISIYEIDEEKLIDLKSYDYYMQTNFYFWLIDKINFFENEKRYDELAYSHYLMSYFIFIILTPLSYENLAFNHINKALRYKNELKYKEWFLIFSTLPNNFIKTYDAIKIAEEVIDENPNSTLANTILQMF